MQLSTLFLWKLVFALSSAQFRGSDFRRWKHHHTYQSITLRWALDEHQKCFSSIETSWWHRQDQKSGSNASESTSSVREKHLLQKAEKFNLGKVAQACSTASTVMHSFQCKLHSEQCTLQYTITLQYYTMSFSSLSFTWVHYTLQYIVLQYTALEFTVYSSSQFTVQYILSQFIS